MKTMHIGHKSLFPPVPKFKSGENVHTLINFFLFLFFYFLADLIQIPHLKQGSNLIYITNLATGNCINFNKNNMIIRLKQF